MIVETPLERLLRLEAIRERIVTGSQEVEVEHEGGNGTRVRAKFGSADLARLDGMIAQARAALSPQTVARSRTFYPRTSRGLT